MKCTASSLQQASPLMPSRISSMEEKPSSKVEQASCKISKAPQSSRAASIQTWKIARGRTTAWSRCREFVLGFEPPLQRYASRIQTRPQGNKSHTSVHIFTLCAQDYSHEERMMRVRLYCLYDPSWLTRQGVHFGLFFGALQGNADSEQIAEWAPLAMGLQIFGCFGMTEIGHGSHVRGIETRATFVPGAGEQGDGEWEIHTPSLTATKWWIGGLAHTATHCTLYARCVTADGQDHGVHVFFVPIRDRETGVTFPGLTVGDCGAKMGRHGIDNGWVQFNKYRIPRRNMLMKHATVSAQGVFQRKPKSTKQMAYGALIGGRASMVQDSADFLQMALTIAVRYGAVRRQGETITAETQQGLSLLPPHTDAKLEPQLLDYSSHQHILMPLLAHAYAFQFTASAMYRLVDELSDADPSTAGPLLGDVHATSAGLKAFCTWKTLEGIDLCRQCCGGHGYSTYNKLGTMYDDFAVQLTWEGANTVMALQTARKLVSSLRDAQSGVQLSGSVTYLAGKPAAPPITEAKQLLSWDNQYAAMRWHASTAVRLAVAAIARGDSEGSPASATVAEAVGEAAVAAAAASSAAAGSTATGSKAAWNSAAPLLLQASKAHVYFNMACWFQDAIERAAADAGSADAVQTLQSLRSLFVLHHLQDSAAFFLQHGGFSPSQSAWVQASVMQLCGEIRLQAIPLVDVFHFSDFLVGAPLGRADGNVYPSYMQAVLAAPGYRNTTGGPNAPYFKAVIAPLLQGEDFGAAAKL